MREIMLALFLVACYVAADKAAEWQVAKDAAKQEEKSYSEEDRRQMDELVGFVIKEAEPVVLYHKPTHRERQAAAVVAKVYHITPENMNDDIFGGAK